MAYSFVQKSINGLILGVGALYVSACGAQAIPTRIDSPTAVVEEAKGGPTPYKTEVVPESTHTLEAMVVPSPTARYSSPVPTTLISVQTPSPYDSQPTVIPTSTPIATTNPTQISTPTLQPPTATPNLVSLEGKIFFDQNGNAAPDSGEIPLSGYEICAINNCAKSNQDGKFKLVLSPSDSSSTIGVTIKDPNMNDCSKAMRYANVLNASVTKQPIAGPNFSTPEQILNSTTLFSLGKEVYVPLKGGEIGLVQGPFTLPFPSGQNSIWTWYDRDSRIGFVADWRGRSANLFGKKYDNSLKIFDQHYGIDWLVPSGTYLYAPAQGIITSVSVEKVPPGEGQNFMILTIKHPDLGLYTHFGDIELNSVVVDVGSTVYRGQILGRAMKTNPGPGDYPLPNMIHGQIQTKQNIAYPLVQSENPDFYGSGKSECSNWTVYNDPKSPK
jgi:murein DD-endopeptidase MepM/ murein hydrolase activator NlpD